MPNGLVKFFNAAKGFGFITADEGGKDIFVPATSIAASGIASLKPGQRVSFETQPDAKGPKAINLKVIANAPPPHTPVVRPVQVANVPSLPKLTIYLDPNCDKAQMALHDLRAAGENPHLVNYIAAPPSRDELKSLSMLLRDAGQNLVRKYDPLFQELRLDDRFISDADFWGGIFENPALINGPVLKGGGRAAICRTEGAVEEFLALLSGKPFQRPVKPKVLVTVPAIVKAMMPSGKAILAPMKAHQAPAKPRPAADERPLAVQPKAALKPKPKVGKKLVAVLSKEIKAKAVTKAGIKKPAKKIASKVAKKKIKPRSR